MAHCSINYNLFILNVDNIGNCNCTESLLLVCATSQSSKPHKNSPESVGGEAPDSDRRAHSTLPELKTETAQDLLRELSAQHLKPLTDIPADNLISPCLAQNLGVWIKH